MISVADTIKFLYDTDTDALDILRYTPYSHDCGYWSAFSSSVRDFSFNHILPVREISATDALKHAANEFETLNREHVACITPLSAEYGLIDIPELKLIHADAWMKFENSSIELYKDPLIDIRQIDSTNMQQYIDVFNLGFSDHVYNTLEDGYQTIERKSFNNPYKIKKMAFINSEPVGIVSATIKSQTAYIEAFTIVPKYRMGGKVAKCLGTDILNVCHKKGVTNIFLITAAGTALERFYEMNGFKTKFYGRFYTWK
jgi:hypothetical protein